MTTALRTIYQLKITLLDIEPVIWRRLLVTNSTGLDELHNALQIIMGWKNCHLHQYVVGQKCYGIPDENFPENIINENVHKINDLLRRENDSLIYDYDFGDGWRHEVLLEKILPYEKEVELPLCIGGEYACPPEDIGGIPGYYNFLEVIKNPAHEEHEDFLEWMGGEFDAKAFDVDTTNGVLYDHY